MVASITQSFKKGITLFTKKEDVIIIHNTLGARL